MTNLQRLLLEIKGIKLDQSELLIYLTENDLKTHAPYDAYSAPSKHNVWRTDLSILESLVNNPVGMKSYKIDDMTISQFHENLMSRIDQLKRSIRKLKTDEQVNNNSDYFMLFR